MKERDLQRAVLDYFALQKDCFAIRVNTQGVPLHGRDGFRPSPMKGIADILVCIKGRFLAIELKSDKGKVSLEEQTFLDSVHKSGGFAIVASSLDAVMDIVEQIKKTQYDFELLNQIGITKSQLNPRGIVYVKDEVWSAESYNLENNQI